MHRYRVTLEPLTDNTTAPISFEADCHDDIAVILQRASTRFGLDQNDTTALVSSFKLFGELVLKHRNESPFAEIRPALRDFVQALKAAGTTE